MHSLLLCILYGSYARGDWVEDPMTQVTEDAHGGESAKLEAHQPE